MAVYGDSRSNPKTHRKVAQQIDKAKVDLIVHTGDIVLNSLEAIEELRGITRNGDEIGAEGHNRDDRSMALAMMIRAWEEKLRRGLIAQNRTKEADIARRRMSIIDQFQLFNRYSLNSFFETKSAVRRADALTAAQQALHIRSRLTPPPRSLGARR